MSGLMITMAQAVKTMRAFVAIAAILMLGNALRADDASRRGQVDAATASAVAHLLTDIETQPLSADLTVKAFVDKTGSEPQLVAVLQQAQQIGGPRWSDDQTCQVQLAIPGASISAQLVKIAQTNSDSSPLKPDAVSQATKPWEARVFSAMGTSTGSIGALRPPASSEAWKGVNDADIHQAVTAARQNAVARVLESLSPQPLTSGRHVGDLLALSDVSPGMTQWLLDRPVTLVDFRDDRKVEVTLSLSATDLVAHLREVVAGRTDFPQPTDGDWSALTELLHHAMASAVGVGSVVPTTQPTAVDFPLQPPQWVDRQLDAEGVGAVSRSKLRSARLAEQDAAAQLQKLVMELPVGNKTLADLGVQNPRIAHVVHCYLESAHNYSTDYLADGSVHLRMSLDLNDLWDRVIAAR